MRLRPQLADDHPGYFGVVATLVFVHLGVAALCLYAEVSDRVQGKALASFITVLGGNLVPFALAHLACVALVLWGLYDDSRFVLLRMGSAISIVTFNVTAITFGALAFEGPIVGFFVLYSALLSAGFSVCSYLCLKEPKVNPAARRRM